MYDRCLKVNQSLSRDRWHLKGRGRTLRIGTHDAWLAHGCRVSSMAFKAADLSVAILRQMRFHCTSEAAPILLKLGLLVCDGKRGFAMFGSMFVAVTEETDSSCVVL